MADQQEHPGLFSVDSESGVVTCLRKLDREKLESPERPLRALVVATDGELSSTATVAVTVEDANDNAPLFARLYSANVSEAAPVGSVLVKMETRWGNERKLRFSPQNITLIT